MTKDGNMKQQQTITLQKQPFITGLSLNNGHRRRTQAGQKRDVQNTVTQCRTTSGRIDFRQQLVTFENSTAILKQLHSLLAKKTTNKVWDHIVCTRTPHSKLPKLQYYAHSDTHATDKCRHGKTHIHEYSALQYLQWLIHQKCSQFRMLIFLLLTAKLYL